MNVKTNWKLPARWDEIRILNWVSYRSGKTGTRVWMFRPPLQKRVVLDKPLPQTEEK